MNNPFGNVDLDTTHDELIETIIEEPTDEPSASRRSVENERTDEQTLRGTNASGQTRDIRIPRQRRFETLPIKEPATNFKEREKQTHLKGLSDLSGLELHNFNPREQLGVFGENVPSAALRRNLRGRAPYIVVETVRRFSIRGPQPCFKKTMVGHKRRFVKACRRNTQQAISSVASMATHYAAPFVAGSRRAGGKRRRSGGSPQHSPPRKKSVQKHLKKVGVLMKDAFNAAQNFANSPKAICLGGQIGDYEGYVSLKHTPCQLSFKKPPAFKAPKLNFDGTVTSRRRGGERVKVPGSGTLMKAKNIIELD
ncbi:Oidioi.mRNA.OKI2018_I69.chr1.g1457.t2.cds [Oikopleura dioica]|uniref:Oidioi.mRNA.OKI2018_I69.chr1.g1457.t2.cds n=1 Tax=Oikopleura dioica TaxID=34765 RepID=A0ABN7SMZ5_OIKDI|nr:Oidioi.mRNA.OKI2018_I69.chr1.g1457.t2.cds [Oikopleura dioica]